jgi:hypothetical protein
VLAGTLHGGDDLVAADAGDDFASAVVDQKIAIGDAAAERLGFDGARPDRQFGDAPSRIFMCGIDCHRHLAPSDLSPTMAEKHEECPRKK